MDDFDFLGADTFSAMGEAPVLVVAAADWQRPTPDIQAACIGVDRVGALPDVDGADFDVLLTSAADPPAPWVSIPSHQMDRDVEALALAVRRWPVAATTLCRVLRISERLTFAEAIELESLAYSVLLGGAEFARWRQALMPNLVPIQEATPVHVEREADVVRLTLNHPEASNAMTAAMRDALHAALATVLDDPSAPKVILQAKGKCFSTGGSLGEFGTASDLAQAHIVRSLRSCAALLNRLGERASVRLHGACVGSGLEVPAAAKRRIASANAWFQLPELRMGLLPGAGGTASVSRAIGRHRTAWMVLSGKRIRARLALDWGLVHEIET